MATALTSMASELSFDMTMTDWNLKTARLLAFRKKRLLRKQPCFDIHQTEPAAVCPDCCLTECTTGSADCQLRELDFQTKTKETRFLLVNATHAQSGPRLEFMSLPLLQNPGRRRSAEEGIAGKAKNTNKSKTYKPLFSFEEMAKGQVEKLQTSREATNK